jgi:hypothetical protein
MSRHEFGPLEHEPDGLNDYYRVLSEADSTVRFGKYIVPAPLQTADYAQVTLEKVNSAHSGQRAITRLYREGFAARDTENGMCSGCSTSRPHISASSVNFSFPKAQVFMRLENCRA